MTLVSLSLVAQREGEGIEERLARVVNRLVRARNEARDRTGNENAPFVVVAQIAPHSLNEVEGSGDIGLDHLAPGVGVLVEKPVAEPPARVREQGVHWPAAGFDGAVKLFDAFLRRKIGFHRLDLRARASQFLRRRLDLGFVGGDDEIVAFARRVARKLIADAGRGAGDDGQMVHDESPVFFRRPAPPLRASIRP